jgi:hypothetical protein
LARSRRGCAAAPASTSTCRRWCHRAFATVPDEERPALGEAGGLLDHVAGHLEAAEAGDAEPAEGC